MPAIKPARVFFWGILGLQAIGTMVYAGYFVYATPDGSVLYIDRPVYDKGYQLLRAPEEAEKSVTPIQAGPRLAEPRRSPFDPLIARVAAAHNVDFALVKAIVHVESAFNPQAISQKGALGLMQLMPQTAARYGYDVLHMMDPMQNIDAGVRHLRYLLDTFQQKQSLAAAAYNAGEYAVLKYQGIPPYAETQEYVKRVLHYLGEYRQS